MRSDCQSERQRPLCSPCFEVWCWWTAPDRSAAPVSSSSAPSGSLKMLGLSLWIRGSPLRACSWSGFRTRYLGEVRGGYQLRSLDVGCYPGLGQIPAWYSLGLLANYRRHYWQLGGHRSHPWACFPYQVQTLRHLRFHCYAYPSFRSCGPRY